MSLRFVIIVVIYAVDVVWLIGLFLVDLWVLYLLFTWFVVLLLLFL